MQGKEKSSIGDDTLKFHLIHRHQFQCNQHESTEVESTYSERLGMNSKQPGQVERLVQIQAHQKAKSHRSSTAAINVVEESMEQAIEDVHNEILVASLTLLLRCPLR